MTKTRKWTLIGVAGVLLAYVAYVTAFELRMGLGQPQFGNFTLVMHTTRADGSEHQRVLARLQHEGRLYVAVNHWPRAWYHQALANPEVRVTVEGQTGDYMAVPVTGDELRMLEEQFPMGFGSRFQMGFPPRHFVRLDPAQGRFVGYFRRFDSPLPRQHTGHLIDPRRETT